MARKYRAGTLPEGLNNISLLNTWLSEILRSWGLNDDSGRESEKRWLNCEKKLWYVCLVLFLAAWFHEALVEGLSVLIKSERISDLE